MDFYIISIYDLNCSIRSKSHLKYGQSKASKDIHLNVNGDSVCGRVVGGFSFLLLICNQQPRDAKINGWKDSEFIIIVLDVLISTRDFSLPWLFPPSNVNYAEITLEGMARRGANGTMETQANRTKRGL